jgi:hypothetical protein
VLTRDAALHLCAYELRLSMMSAVMVEGAMVGVNPEKIGRLHPACTSVPHRPDPETFLRLCFAVL